MPFPEDNTTNIPVNRWRTTTTPSYVDTFAQGLPNRFSNTDSDNMGFFPPNNRHRQQFFFPPDPPEYTARYEIIQGPKPGIHEYIQDNVRDIAEILRYLRIVPPLRFP